MTAADWAGEVDIHEPEALAIEELHGGDLVLPTLTVRVEAERLDDGWNVRVVAYGHEEGEWVELAEYDPERGAVELPASDAPEVALLRGQVEAAAYGWADEAYRLEQLRASEERLRQRVLSERVRDAGAAIAEALRS